MSTRVKAEPVARLVHEFSYTAELRAPAEIGPGPYGTRMFVGLIGGEVVGERLSGKALDGGGDWILINDDGYARLDVRAQFETDDGAVIYLSYVGLMHATPAAQAALAGGEQGTEFGDPYFVAAPRLESGDPRYSWVNQSTFVAVGRINPGPVVEYSVSRVEVGTETP